MNLDPLRPLLSSPLSSLEQKEKMDEWLRLVHNEHEGSKSCLNKV
jgi:hypothetical protein